MAGLLGDDAKFYYSNTPLSSTSYATPLSTATELGIISNLTLNLSNDNPQYRIRSDDWVLNGVSKHDGSISFEMQWKPTDGGFAIIKTAFLNKAEIAGFALDQAKGTSGAQGVASNFVVTNFTRNEPVGEFQTVSVELKPSSYSGWHTV